MGLKVLKRVRILGWFYKGIMGILQQFGQKQRKAAQSLENSQVERLCHQGRSNCTRGAVAIRNDCRQGRTWRFAFLDLGRGLAKEAAKGRL